MPFSVILPHNTFPERLNLANSIGCSNAFCPKAMKSKKKSLYVWQGKLLPICNIWVQKYNEQWFYACPWISLKRVEMKCAYIKVFKASSLRP